MKNNGGPAFPYQPGDWQVDNTGMTLRDYFAAKAMQSLLICESKGPVKYENEYDLRIKAVALTSYDMADSMIAASKGGSGDE